MIRLFFNRHGDRPWSVDNGPGTPERTFKQVLTSALGKTVYRPLTPGEDPEEVPRAWIEYDGLSEVEVRDELALIYKARPKDRGAERHEVPFD